MRRKGTIQSQLLATLVTGLLVMAMLSWWVVGIALREMTANYLEYQMDGEMASILTAISLDDQDNITLDDRHIDTLFHHLLSGYYFQITSHRNENPQILRSQSLGEHTLHHPTITPGEALRHKGTGPKNEPLLMLIKSITMRNNQLTVIVATDLSPIDKELNDYLWIHGLLFLFGLVLLTIMQIWAIRRAIRPIEEIREGVMQLETGQISRLHDDVPDEIRPVVEEINQLLLRMEQRLVRSRSTIANLAHAMKSPLTTLSQILRREESGLNEDQRMEVLNRLDDLHALIEKELRRARLADHPIPARFFNPEQSLGMLARTLNNIHFQKQFTIDLDLPSGLLLPFDEEDMIELLGNLLDNACKWCRTSIRVTMIEERSKVIMRVEDDGPGVAQAETEHLTRRGVRLDEKRSGHGLGLAMVQETVDHFGGTIEFGRSRELNGFLAEVTLPIKRFF
ncbi:MAG: sensor histidine kinase [Magnetococcales bacterium]|nr:sensor histidine kinase [Magnetococcales bacterium]NGZ06769.1 sensor histidine kinase [Magnetococcales bacterium]